MVQWTENIKGAIDGKLKFDLQVPHIHWGSRVGKKWEPRNPVPGPFSAKIRKVNQNSESRREFGKYSKNSESCPEIRKGEGVRPKKKKEKEKKVLTYFGMKN